MIHTLRTISRTIAMLLAALASLASWPAAANDPAASPQARPALWKVADHDTTIWLFGTIHALPEDVDWLSGPVASAFDGSRELVTEIITPDPAQMQALVLAKATQPKGRTLRATLTPKLKARYEATMAQLGLPVGAFDAFEPWYAAIGIASLPLVRQGFTADRGVEATLDARAKAHNLSRGALETTEYQLGLFDALPARTQQRYLGEVIANLPEMPRQLQAMVAAWKAGDADRLAELVNEDAGNADLLRVLLTDRNKAWAQWIRHRLDQPGTVFVAVGAGHLAGKGSVQQQLALRGIPTARVQ